MDRPVPTSRAAWLLALGLIPAALGVTLPGWAGAAMGFDLLLLALLGLDFWRAPRPRRLSVRRELEPVLSAGIPNRVRLHLEAPAGTRGPVRGTLRDVVAPGPRVEGLWRRFELDRALTLEGWITPSTRGDLQLLGVWVRLEGRLGLCARQAHLGLEQTVRVYPNLVALAGDRLSGGRSAEAAARRAMAMRAEGREFESLREYRAGDDRRTIDWKATARRGRTMVRLHRPERDQRVVLLLDCGRHMAGAVGGRRKLDHSVDAALRLAMVGLELGDAVGVVGFGLGVKCAVRPERGKAQLATIAQALYRLEASLEESDYGPALEAAFAGGQRRSLLVIMTDLLDSESAAALLGYTRRLRPRHLPLVASLFDAELHQTALGVPRTIDEAHLRLAAARLEAEARATVAHLRSAGAWVVRTAPSAFGASSVEAYLAIKSRGAL